MTSAEPGHLNPDEYTARPGSTESPKSPASRTMMNEAPKSINVPSIKPSICLGFKSDSILGANNNAIADISCTKIPNVRRDQSTSGLNSQRSPISQVSITTDISSKVAAPNLAPTFPKGLTTKIRCRRTGCKT